MDPINGSGQAIRDKNWFGLAHRLKNWGQIGRVHFTALILGYDGDANGTFEINKAPLISFQKNRGHGPGEFEMQALICLKWFGFGHHDNCSDFVDIKFHMEHKSFFAATWIQPSIIFQTSFKGKFSRNQGKTQQVLDIQFN